MKEPNDRTIYYICKYTPLEMLAGFGLEAQGLDPAPVSFDCAEGCTHPNLCGYGKAVLEEVLTRGIRRLLLVDCCDVCRRIYDVLKIQGSMEFLFLMSLPHKNGPAEVRLLTRELERLHAELEPLVSSQTQMSMTETSPSPFWDEKSALKSWMENAMQARQSTLTTPHIRLTGAHGGSLLRSMIEAQMPLPVQDDTCTGRRELTIPSGDHVAKESFSASWSMETYAASLLSQSRPCMRMQFRTEDADPGSVGTICHTVKFCDYYSFQYRRLRGNKEEPLLKIETDCTPQSSGQLRTRLEAFAETLRIRQKLHDPRPENTIGTATAQVPVTPTADAQVPATRNIAAQPAAADLPTYNNTSAGHNAAEISGSRSTTTEPRLASTFVFTAGVDSGSTSTDAVILDQNRRIVGKAILPTGAGASAGAEKALASALEQAGLSRGDLAAVVTTGYGRSSIGLSDFSVTEITCHAKGAHFLYPAARTVIDIGGQDSKVIRLDADGNVVNFVMNDKCAAGTGRFLEMMARTLEMSLLEMSSLGLNWKKEVAISSMCTVFAESEVVSLIADNTPPADIIHGLNMAVAGKTLSLMKRLGNAPAYIMTGGVGQNQGVVKALEERLGESVYVPQEAQLCGALGAALIAAEQLA